MLEVRRTFFFVFCAHNCDQFLCAASSYYTLVVSVRLHTEYSFIFEIMI